VYFKPVVVRVSLVERSCNCNTMIMCVRQDMEPTPLTGINAPFTGTKWQVWEGGVRMPGIAWGGPVAGAARTALDVVASTDVYATGAAPD
jgi:arylsulfatase A-like enzyme